MLVLCGATTAAVQIVFDYVESIRVDKRISVATRAVLLRLLGIVNGRGHSCRSCDRYGHVWSRGSRMYALTSLHTVAMVMLMVILVAMR